LSFNIKFGWLIDLAERQLTNLPPEHIAGFECIVQRDSGFPSEGLQNLHRDDCRAGGNSLLRQ
jgi:hypothetical protein